MKVCRNLLTVKSVALMTCCHSQLVKGSSINIRSKIRYILLGMHVILIRLVVGLYCILLNSPFSHPNDHDFSNSAGLGLNTAFLEAHNLAWKVGLVLKGVALSQILSTYGLERHGVAKELVQMDRRLVEIYAGLEKQSIDNYTDASEWLSTLHTFQASHYAVSSFRCS